MKISNLEELNTPCLILDKTLLEKNFASINCRNSKTRTGAEVIIKWNNKDLFNI